MLKIKIEKGHPMPESRTHERWDFLSAMKIGDSFEVDRKRGNAALAAGRIRGVELIMRKTRPGFVRIWRAA